MKIVRLLAVAVLVCAAALAQPLRELAQRRSIHIGAAVNPTRLAAEPQYAETLAREFDQVEPENATKFGPIHPEPDRYNFGPADAILAFAKEHKMVFRGHTLVWHRQTAAWVNEAEDRAKVMKDHIAAVVGHFAGQAYAWDAVNEAVNDDGTMRKSVWSDTPDYIEQAFRAAHAADPKALLFYNDFSAEGLNAKSDAIYKMVKDFKSRGVPIDGVGLQMHFTTKPPAMDSIEANMKRLTALGLQVQITELDVRLPVPADDAALQAQAEVYRQVFAACLKFPKCTAIQTWGFTDKYSWIPMQNRGFGAALPFDAEYRPKPAYDAIKKALQ